MAGPSYFPSYSGTFNADDDLVAPWWIPGWTAQDKITEQARHPAGLPGFPVNLAFARITGTYLDPNGAGAAGFLTLGMSESVTVTDNGASFRLPARLTGVMNQHLGFAYANWGNGQLYLQRGHLDIEVFCTDQTASGVTIATDSGQPLCYNVTEHMPGGRAYQLAVPASASPGPADIASLIVPGSIRPYAYDPVNPLGNLPAPPPAA